MLDLLSTNTSAAGQANTVTKIKAPAPGDQRFERSLETHKTRPADKPHTTESARADRDQPVAHDDAAHAIDRNIRDDDHPTQPSEHAQSDDPDAVDSQHEPAPIPPDETSSESSTEQPAQQDNPDETPGDANHAVAAQWHEHLLTLAQQANASKSAAQAQQRTAQHDGQQQAGSKLEARAVELKHQGDATQDSSDDQATANANDPVASSAHGQQAATTVARTSITATETSNTDADTSQATQTSLQDAALASVASDLAQQDTGAQSKPKTDSRLLASLKQDKSTQAQATAGKIDPFKVADTLNQPPPTAVVRTTLAPQQSPIHLQAIEPGTQASSESQSTQERGNLAAVTRGLAAAVRQRGGLVTIKLSPESLGPVRIQMSIQQGNVNVQFDAASEQTRDLLQRNMDSLRATLQSKGFGIERLSVQTSPGQFDTGSKNSSQDAQQDRLTQQQNHDAGDGKSKGRSDNDPKNQHQQDQSQTQDFDQQWRLAVNATA